MALQWPLIIFTLCLCLAGGTLAGAGILSLLGKGTKVQKPALILSVAALVVGGIGSFMHLQHWERIFNGFGHITSGITQELIAIVLFAIVLIIYFVMLRKSEDGAAPKWCAILAIAVGVVMVFVTAHSYNMAARIAWNSILLEIYYLGNAALLGGMAILALAGLCDADALKPASKIALYGSIFGLLATLLYAVVFAGAPTQFAQYVNVYDFAHPTIPYTDVAGLLALGGGTMMKYYWLGAVIVGAVVPVVIAVIAGKLNAKTAGVAALCGLIAGIIGGICFRALLYVVGFSVFAIY